MEMTLGKRIAESRKQLGLTQDQLAEQLGVTAQAVSKWEHDQSSPDITSLPKLAEIFGTTTDALLGMETVHEAEVVPEEQEPEGFRYENGNMEFRYDGGRKTSIGVAAWVLLTGGLMLVGALLQKEVELWDILWSSGLMVFGLFGLYPRFSFLRAGCAFFGGYYLLGNFCALPFGKNLILPILLVLFGLSLLTDALRRPKKPTFIINGKKHQKNTFSCEDEQFLCDTSFGENRRNIQLSRLSGGEASVSFGELTVDITGCEEFAPDCRLELTCSFGELELLVPRSCRVEHTDSSAFASIELKGRPDPDAPNRIFLNCSANFGEICIKYI